MAHIRLTGLSFRDGFKVSGFDETSPPAQNIKHCPQYSRSLMGNT